MKTTIIGAGNMGGAIACGLMDKGLVQAGGMTICDTSTAVTSHFRELYPEIIINIDSKSAVRASELIIIAVKPWLMEEVLRNIAPAVDGSKIVVSIAAGITFGQMSDYLYPSKPALFRVIPNTAISIGQSVTFISSYGADEKSKDSVKALFAALGDTFIVTEDLITSGTALASCGIAYALRYLDAAAKGGVELGIDYDESLKIVMKTMRGALALLDQDPRPQALIDRVTTPGGITMKGLEEMERGGFTDAVISGLKASK